MRATACSARSTSARRPAERDGHRDHRLRHQRLDGRLGAARRPSGHRLRGRRQARRPRQDSDRRDAQPAPIPVDTGFHRLQRADVSAVHRPARRSSASRPSRATCRSAPRATRCGIAYSSRGARGFFPDPLTATRPMQWRMLADVTRFYRDARRVIDGAGADAPRRSATGWTNAATGRGFRDHFLVPITSAVWSTAADRIHDFPVDYLLHFLDNHGLIGYGNAPQWRVVTRRLAGATSNASSGAAGWQSLRAGDPVVIGRARRRSASRIATRARASTSVRRRRHGHPRRRRPAPARRRRRPRAPGARRLRVLARIAVVLHTDERVLPANPRARARGTSAPPDCRRPGDALTMTYHMNRLQSLPGPIEYCVSLNPGDGSGPNESSSSAHVQPPDVHVPHARRRRRGVGGAPGPAPDLVRRRAPRLRVPRGRLPVRVRGGRDDRPTPTRRWRHEVAPARGQRPPPARPAVQLRARARRLLLRPRPRRARRRRPTAPPRQPQSRATSCRSATRDHLPPPATDLPTLTCGRTFAREGDRCRRLVA